MQIRIGLLALYLATGISYAKDLGVVGVIYPIIEQDFLELITSRLQELKERGDLQALEKAWLKNVQKHADRPKPLEIPRAELTSRHTYYPEVVLNSDITDANNQVLFAKGTRVNALQKLPSYFPCWLLFNADDAAQIRWAQKIKNSCPQPKYILIGGSVKDAEEALQEVIYFDQTGKITKKLHITAVPAQVTRQEFALVIEQIAIKENGDAV